MGHDPRRLEGGFQEAKLSPAFLAADIGSADFIDRVFDRFGSHEGSGSLYFQVAISLSIFV